MLDDHAAQTIFARFAERWPEENQARRKTPQVGIKIRERAFKSLAACMLSAQSLDRNTKLAADALFAVADTPEAILTLPVDRLEQLIRPCGLYRNKARSLGRMARELIDRFGGEVPRTRKELLSLPGVGRKTADIRLRFVWEQPVVPVDTHVFRVSRRLGLAAAKTEAQLAPRLEARIPEELRLGAHIWLLNHGKRTCRSRTPRCGDCFLADLCERNGVTPGSPGPAADPP